MPTAFTHVARKAAAVLAVGALLLAGCSSDDGDTGFGERRRYPAQAATGLTVARDGQLVIGELSSGRILSLDPTSDADPVEVARIDDLDSSLEQGGLLGLAQLRDTQLAVSYTSSSGQLRVVQLDLGTGSETATLWDGPTSVERANGGRLVVLPDGELLIGVGDLLEPDLISDPTAPNGKLMLIGPEGTASPWATGFNNPFALAADPSGPVWVADNAPGSRQERLLRVTPGTVAEEAGWDDTRVPSGIAVLADGSLAICSSATGELGIVDPGDPGDARGRVVADDCRYGVVAIPSGGLAYSAENEVVVLGGPASD